MKTALFAGTAVIALAIVLIGGRAISLEYHEGFSFRQAPTISKFEKLFEDNQPLSIVSKAIALKPGSDGYDLTLFEWSFAEHGKYFQTPRTALLLEKAFALTSPRTQARLIGKFPLPPNDALNAFMRKLLFENEGFAAIIPLSKTMDGRTILTVWAEEITKSGNFKAASSALPYLFQISSPLTADVISHFSDSFVDMIQAKSGIFASTSAFWEGTCLLEPYPEAVKECFAGDFYRWLLSQVSSRPANSKRSVTPGNAVPILKAFWGESQRCVEGDDGFGVCPEDYNQQHNGAANFKADIKTFLHTNLPALTTEELVKLVMTDMTSDETHASEASMCYANVYDSFCNFEPYVDPEDYLPILKRALDDAKSTEPEITLNILHGLVNQIDTDAEGQAHSDGRTDFVMYDDPEDQRPRAKAAIGILSEVLKGQDSVARRNTIVLLASHGIRKLDDQAVNVTEAFLPGLVKRTALFSSEGSFFGNVSRQYEQLAGRHEYSSIGKRFPLYLGNSPISIARLEEWVALANQYPGFPGADDALYRAAYLAYMLGKPEQVASLVQVIQNDSVMDGDAKGVTALLASLMKCGSSNACFAEFRKGEFGAWLGEQVWVPTPEIDTLTLDHQIFLASTNGDNAKFQQLLERRLALDRLRYGCHKKELEDALCEPDISN